MSQQRERRRIGPWRLLDIMQATAPWRASMMGGATVLPEFGPPDVPAPNINPALDLPDSNIGEGEWRRAVERERAWRVLRRSSAD